MKSLKVFYCIVFSFLMLCSSFILGQEISHSHHDFKKGFWNGIGNCSPCHPANEGTSGISASPLWIQQVPGPFDVFSVSVIDGDPGATSKLCLSCHDGTVASQSHGGISYNSIYAGLYMTGSELMDDHPISIPYIYSDDITHKIKLHNPNTTLSGLGGTIAQDLLKNGKVECISCHDIHLTRNTSGCTGCHTKGIEFPATNSLSLWLSSDMSSLCLTCHVN